MWIEILYPFILIISMALTIIGSILLWMWHRHALWGAIDWVDKTNDRILFKLMDWVTGDKGRWVIKNGETYEEERDNAE